MPYIAQENRELLDGGVPIETSGNLNYLISCLLKRYWNESSKRYSTINDIVGALEGAKLEFYRRIAVPYEEKKIKENGDIYE